MSGDQVVLVEAGAAESIAANRHRKFVARQQSRLPVSRVNVRRLPTVASPRCKERRPSQNGPRIVFCSGCVNLDSGHLKNSLTPDVLERCLKKEDCRFPIPARRLGSRHTRTFGRRDSTRQLTFRGEFERPDCVCRQMAPHEEPLALMFSGDRSDVRWTIDDAARSGERRKTLPRDSVQIPITNLRLQVATDNRRHRHGIGG